MTKYFKLTFTSQILPLAYNSRLKFLGRTLLSQKLLKYSVDLEKCIVQCVDESTAYHSTSPLSASTTQFLALYIKFYFVDFYILFTSVSRLP